MKPVQGFSALAEEVPVLLMVDTAGCDMEEQAEEDGDSKRNDGEAKVFTTCSHHQRSDHQAESIPFLQPGIACCIACNLLALCLLYMQRGST